MANQTLRTLLPAASKCLVDAPSELGPEPSFRTQSPVPKTQKDVRLHLQRKHSSQVSYGHRYQSRIKSVEEQWKDIWRILFPGKKPPQSVYLHSDTEETIYRLRAFWSKHRENIINKTVQQSGLFRAGDSSCVANLFDLVVDDFLTQFEAESSISNRPNIPRSLSFTDAVWEDNDSVISAANPYLALEFGDVLDYNRTPAYLRTGLFPGGLEDFSGFETNARFMSSCDVVSDSVHYLLYDTLQDF